tara:strand:- start:6616 stop:7245 length:630 start_codon:yes stop_codon:yes gene_type:complete
MGASETINKRSRIRQQIAKQEQTAGLGDAYFNAVRTSLQSSFRFLLRINGIPFALVSDVDRPNPQFGATKDFQLLNWKFKYPAGTVAWSNVSFTIREVFENSVVDSVAGIVLNKYKAIGHDNPMQIDSNNLKDMSKSALMASLGDVIIEVINPEGDIYEQWRLYGAFIKSISFSKLSYGSPALVGTTIGLSYDWATLTYTDDRGRQKTY